VDDRPELVSPQGWAQKVTAWYGSMKDDEDLLKMAKYFKRVAVDGVGDNPEEVIEYLRTQKKQKKK
jgi:hypothetical protein